MNLNEMIKLKNWAVVGDVNNKGKYAYKILALFKECGYNVVGVHPRGGKGIFTSLKAVDIPIEAIDLCINSFEGIKIVKEAKELGIMNILVQPGAESEEIIRYCEDTGINLIRNCALIQLRNLKKE